MNARLGYAPGGLLGEGGSVYVVVGMHWERASARRGSDINGRSIRIVADHTLRPRVAGVGVEWGSLASRIGLEVRYSAAELEFRTGGDGSALGMPLIDHRFRARGRRTAAAAIRRTGTTSSARARSAAKFATPARSDRGRRVGRPETAVRPERRPVAARSAPGRGARVPGGSGWRNDGGSGTARRRRMIPWQPAAVPRPRSGPVRHAPGGR